MSASLKRDVQTLAGHRNTSRRFNQNWALELTAGTEKLDNMPGFPEGVAALEIREYLKTV
jgi:hypothetical protein